MHKNSLNKVILIGHLGAKPEGRYTKDGRSVVSFSLATNEGWIGVDGKMSVLVTVTITGHGLPGGG